MSTHRLLNLKSLPRQKGRCRNCGGSLPKRARTSCSRECTEIIKLLTLSGYARWAVKQRDRGVCAICGCDTEKVKRILRHAGNSWSFRFETQASLGFGRSSHLWEMDHILPVVYGGGAKPAKSADEILNNLRTLCIPCHRQETARLARLRAACKHGMLSPRFIERWAGLSHEPPL